VTSLAAIPAILDTTVSAMVVLPSGVTRALCRAALVVLVVVPPLVLGAVTVVDADWLMVTSLTWTAWPRLDGRVAGYGCSRTVGRRSARFGTHPSV